MQSMKRIGEFGGESSQILKNLDLKGLTFIAYIGKSDKKTLVSYLELCKDYKAINYLKETTNIRKQLVENFSVEKLKKLDDVIKNSSLISPWRLSRKTLSERVIEITIKKGPKAARNFCEQMKKVTKWAMKHPKKIIAATVVAIVYNNPEMISDSVEKGTKNVVKLVTKISKDIGSAIATGVWEAITNPEAPSEISLKSSEVKLFTYYIHYGWNYIVHWSVAVFTFIFLLYLIPLTRPLIRLPLKLLKKKLEKIEEEILESSDKVELIEKENIEKKLDEEKKERE
jgi:hypothetical protein